MTALITDGETERVITKILSYSNQSVLVVGPKSSGKSTFARILTNSLLSTRAHKSCFYLDLDPGQPEFSPPGLVSLVEVKIPVLGPTYTHPLSLDSQDSRMIRQHAIASTSFKDDPDHFMACALDLYNHALKLRKRHPGVPLIINSCGWVTGTGASVMADFAFNADLSDIVAIDALEQSLMEKLATADERTVLHRLSRRLPAPTSRSPAELRTMQTLAYFHQSRNANWNTKAISEMKTCKVSYGTATSGIAAIMSYNQSFNPEFLAEVLDGSLVAITVIDDESILPERSSPDSEDDHQNNGDLQHAKSHFGTTPEGLPYISSSTPGMSNPLDPTESHCVGLALVRGIDVEAKQIHLVTPLSDTEIEKLAHSKVVLVRGGFDSPDWAYLEDLYRAGEGAEEIFESEERPWLARREMVGIEGRVWRMRHPPLMGRG